MSLLYSTPHPFHLPIQKTRHQISESVHQLSLKSSLFSNVDSADTQQESSSSSSGPIKDTADILFRDNVFSSNRYLKDALSRGNSSSDLSAYLTFENGSASLSEHPPFSAVAPSASASNIASQDLSSILDENWLRENTDLDDNMDAIDSKSSFLSATPPPAFPLMSPTRLSSSSSPSATITPSDIFAPVDASPVLGFPDTAFPPFDYFGSYDPSEYDPAVLGVAAAGYNFAIPPMPSTMTGLQAEECFDHREADPNASSSKAIAGNNSAEARRDPITVDASGVQEQLLKLQKQGLLYDFSQRDRDLIDDPFASLRVGGIGEAGEYGKLLEDVEMEEEEPEMVKFEDDDLDPLMLIHQPSPNNPGRHAGNQPREPTEDLERELQRSGLSSRERRQLRNKISARNFRLRKKEYVTTLEDQLRNSESDRRALRASLTKVLEENRKLKAEVAVYRKAIGGGDILPKSIPAEPLVVADTPPAASSSNSAPKSASAKKAAAVSAKLPALPTKLTAHPTVLPADPALDLWSSLGFPPQTDSFGLLPTPAYGNYEAGLGLGGMDVFGGYPGYGAFMPPTMPTPVSVPTPAMPSADMFGGGYPQDFKTYLEMLGASAAPKSVSAQVSAPKEKEIKRSKIVPVVATVEDATPLQQTYQSLSQMQQQTQEKVQEQYRPRYSSLPATTAGTSTHSVSSSSSARAPASLVFTTPASLLDSIPSTGTAVSAPQAALSRDEYEAIKRNIAAALRENSRQRQGQQAQQQQQQAPLQSVQQNYQQQQHRQFIPGQTPSDVGKVAAVQKEASHAAAAFIQSLLKGTFKETQQQSKPGADGR
ncbi:hypothetical protein HDU93_001387 [Gonapodya sp. JEL0774]|nr:hypothetical protein HDU93_001387 [Gonapodya sp. JEL0774]